MMKTPGLFLLLAALLGSYEAHPVDGEDYPAGAPHPGTCPQRKVMCERPLSRPQCRSDSECLKTEKCCDVCGKQCRPAVRAHAGSCPLPPHVAIPIVCIPGITHETCQDDSSCAEDQKCCKTSCSNQCVKSIRVHAGSCPPPPIHHVEGGTCHGDSSCAVYEKCCETFRGKECVMSF